MNGFKEIGYKEFKINPFDLKHKWMLITAEKEGKVNTMTASWGGFGVLWNKEVVFVVIRPQRYTKEFVDAATSFSLTFFNKEYQKELGYLGKVSGRDEDKITKSGLTIAHEDGIPYFTEANAVLFVKKLYIQQLAPEFFLDSKIDKTWYPENDHHYLYVAEVHKIFKSTEGESFIF